MRINKINHNNQNFKARLCGDYKTIINIVKDTKLPNDTIKYYLQELNRLVPNDKDRIFLFFRKVDGSYFNQDLALRSQVEILRENDPFNLLKLRERIYPFRNKPKDLLRMMVNGVERIVKNKIENTSIPKFYYEKSLRWNNKIFSKIETKDIADFDEKGALIKDLIG